MSVASRAVGGLATLVPWLSFGGAVRLGRALGRLAHRLDGRHRGVARHNLARAFPDRPAAWHRKMARAAFEQAGRTAVELLWSPAVEDDRAAGSTGRFEGLERLERALDRGRGVLLASGHFGNWELMGLLLGRRGLPLHVIARPLDDPDLDAVLQRLRTGTGNRVIVKTEAVRGSLRALRAGHAVAVLTDQNTLRSDAVFVPFFGRQAGTTPLVAQLHLRTGAAVLPSFAVPDGAGYRYVIDEPLDTPAGDRRETVLAMTARITEVVESWIRRHPEAWLWMHDRWRTRPE